ncbi:MAG TPA: tetratricopeptide repeat protein [Steroidobacteraceae bacterium]|nr:tetratricopeptide repeat protein [Steroidobacteraceae bacterium]
MTASEKADSRGAGLELIAALVGAGRYAEALSSLERGTAPETTEHRLLRALARHGLGALPQALADYDAVIADAPDNPVAWLGRARVLLALGRPAGALAAAERALPGPQPSADAWFVRATALQLLGRSSEALVALGQVLAQQPSHVQALTNRAMLLYHRGESRQALRDFQQVLRLDPDCGAARMGRVVAELPWIAASADEVAAARRAFAAALEELAADLRRRPCEYATMMVGSLQPFVLAYQESDNRDLLALYGRICASSMAEWQRAVGLGPHVPQVRAKVRVAIVSAHVHHHAVYQAITRGWLTRLDRSRFEVELFHLGTLRDAQSTTAASLADHYQQGELSPLDWSRAITARSPDVILYPEVGMDAITLQLASQRLAPVQIAAWGHPQTTGLPTIDYFLSAAAFEPAAAQEHYVEQLVLLPNLGCYYDPEVVPVTPPEPRPREKRRVRLVCAGSPFKYAPEHDQVLVEIARRAPEAELSFFSYDDGVLSARLRARLEAAFRAAGLEPAARLVWRPWCDPARFHEFLHGADLLLDTIGFSGFNTVAQALGCGLPVVTQRGRFMRGRLGAAIVSHLSLDALAVDTPDAYVERVVSLTRDPASRAQLREAIRTSLPRLYRDASCIEYLQSFLETAVKTPRARPPRG